jgi:hypothetical protein
MGLGGPSGSFCRDGQESLACMPRHEQGGMPRSDSGGVRPGREVGDAPEGWGPPANERGRGGQRWGTRLG